MYFALPNATTFSHLPSVLSTYLESLWLNVSTWPASSREWKSVPRSGPTSQRSREAARVGDFTTASPTAACTRGAYRDAACSDAPRQDRGSRAPARATGRG